MKQGPGAPCFERTVGKSDASPRAPLPPPPCAPPPAPAPRSRGARRAAPQFCAPSGVTFRRRHTRARGRARTRRAARTKTQQPTAPRPPMRVGPVQCLSLNVESDSRREESRADAGGPQAPQPPRPRALPLTCRGARARVPHVLHHTNSPGRALSEAHTYAKARRAGACRARACKSSESNVVRRSLNAYKV